MNRKEIAEKVIIMISRKLSIDSESVSEESNISGDFQADSLDVVDIVMTIEDEYEIMIADEEAEKWTTVKSVIDYIEGKLNG